MNMYAILIGAAAGGIAAVLARLLFDPKEKKGAYTGTLVAGFMLLNLLGREYVLPRLELRNVEAELQKVPAFAALKEHDPETFDGIMTQVREAGGTGDKNKVFQAVRVEILKVVEERVPTASDEAVVNYISATMDEVDELYEGGGDLCFNFLFPKPGEHFDVSKHVSKEALDADLEALAEVIRTSATDPQEIPGDAEVMPNLGPIVANLAEFYGSDFAMLANPHASDVNKRKSCQIAADMYDKILELPAETSGKILRNLLSKA